MQAEVLPMLQIVVELVPTAAGGMQCSVGVTGITPDAVPVAVSCITAAIQALTGRAAPALPPAVPDASPYTVLGRIRVDVLDVGLLHVRSYIDGKCDSGGLYFPVEAGPAISATIKEVRDAVASRVHPR